MPDIIRSNQFDWVGQTLVWPDKDKGWQELRLVQFERYSKWCEAVSVTLYNRLKIPGVEPLDFIQYGSIGLLEAIDRYKPKFGVPFKNYAFRRIRGSVYNNVFRFTEKAHLKNWQNNRLEERINSLTDQNSKEKGSAAEALIMTILDTAIGLFIEHHETEDLCTLEGQGYFTHEIDIMQKSLVEKIQYLPPRQKHVMELHYVELMSFTSIAEELNISTGRVSQLHKQGINALRSGFTD